MSSILKCVAILCCAFSAAAKESGAVSAQETISFQLHSANDLREWPQFLGKMLSGNHPENNLYFKIDAHHSILHPKCKDHRGCLLMTHDDPLPMYDYFSVKDMVDTAVKALDIIPKHFSMKIAICFKAQNVLLNVCDSRQPLARSWLSLVDDFVAYANDKTRHLVSHKKPRIEFILDGIGTPNAKCLAQRWRPWNATYISTENGLAALTSNDASSGYDRYAILNDPTDIAAWTSLASSKVQYGKFKSSPYTMLLWEPDSENDIVQYSKLYLNSGVVHQPGFRFAINIDPIMFQLYSSSVSSTSWSEYLTDSVTPVGLEGFANGIKLLVGNDAEGNAVFKFSTSDDGDARDVIDVTWRDIQRFPVTIVDPVRQKNGKRRILKWSSSEHELLGCGLFDDGQVCTYHIQTMDGGKLKLLACGNIKSVIPSLGDVLSVTIITKDSLLIIKELPNSGFIFYNYKVTHNSLTSVGSYSFQMNGIAIPRISSLSVSMIRTVKSHLEYTGLAVLSDGAFVYISSIGAVLHPHENHIHSVTLDKFVKIGVGSSSTVSVKRGEECGRSHAVIISNAGYCYNSHVHNTRSGPKICDSSPASTRGVLDYTFGKVEAFERYIRQTKKAGWGTLINVCNEDFFHGSFSLGENAVGSISYLARGNNGSGDDIAYRNRSSQVTIHAAYVFDSKKTIDVGKCGLPANPPSGTSQSTTKYSEWNLDDYPLGKRERGVEIV